MFPVKMLLLVLVLVYKDVCNSGVGYTASIWLIHCNCNTVILLYPRSLEP